MGAAGAAAALLDDAPTELGALEPVLQKMGLPSHPPRSGEQILSDLHTAARALQANARTTAWTSDRSTPSEGVVVLPQQQGILGKAPHPNAAKLFSEFMTSQEAGS